MIRPETEADLVEAVRTATGPLRLKGGGTRSFGQPDAGQELVLSGLAGVTLYEPGALTLVVRAGTPLAEVEATLAAEGQRLPFEPPDLRALLGTEGVSTIGGVVAANASGPRRMQAGACRDSLIGVRFVDGTGAVIRNGGRVMKNVTGYDLVKLMAGSHGTLGALTEVSFKLLPVPADEATLVFADLPPERAVSLMADAMGSPFEVTGAAHERGVGTCLRLEGLAASVLYRAEELARRLRRYGSPRRETAAASAALWRSIRDVAAFAGKPGDVWSVSTRASDAPGLIDRAAAQDVLMDWGGARLWFRTDEGSDLRAVLGSFVGHATLVRASPETRARLATFPPEPPAIAALAQGLRARFDPRGILNPGLMA
jgi:glycolate oxidase FAD binding subunit